MLTDSSQAIVDGDPPDLPSQGYSDAARDFARGCLNKIPKLRPTYAMLLRHGWLAQLLQPPLAGQAAPTNNDVPDTADAEVADWVVAAIERRRNGSMGKSAKPALHAVPLDTVHSPPLEPNIDGQLSIAPSAAD